MTTANASSSSSSSSSETLPASTSRGKAIVIGGGVIGAASAHFLRQSGWQVTILDKGAFGAGCSASNCGLVCPSHVLPLAEPGAIGRTFKAMLQKNSPFSIKPRLDLSLWAWLFAFARKCNEQDFLKGARAIQPLLESSLTLYREIIQNEKLDCEWQEKGLLYVYKTKKAFEDYVQTERLLATQFGCPARRIESDELTEIEPALKPGLAGGWLYDHDSQVRPNLLMKAWQRNLILQGVTIREHCEFTGFGYGKHTNQAAQVQTAQGDPIAADVFVVATGAWTPKLNKELGCQVPIQPGKGYSLTMPRPTICPKIPLMFTETRVVATPFPSGYRLGSTMEFAGYDDTLNPKRLQLLKDGAEPYLREPYREPIQEKWYGWRPMTSDSVPIIDRSPRFKNVIIAAGHNMLGLSMAPGTGKLVAQLLNEESPGFDVSPYRVNRF